MTGSEITAAAEGFVRISGLGKVFRREEGSVQVLRNVSITVPNRQFISILGASGCGGMLGGRTGVFSVRTAWLISRLAF